MPVRRRTQASARLAAQHVGAKRLATPSQALSTIAYTDRLSRSAPYADPPKHCSALILKRRGKRARLFRDRAISTLIFDEREMELLSRHSAIGREEAASRSAEKMKSASRRLKRAVLVVPGDVNPSS